MFVKYNPKDSHVKTIPIIIASQNSETIPFANDSVILKPGTNEITEQEWAAIQPHIKEEIAKKEIVAFTVPVSKNRGKNGKAGTLKDVPSSTARKIIESCNNITDLKKWVNQELPDEIMLLVLKRLRRLKVDPDDLLEDERTGETLDADITPEGNDNTAPKVEKADTGGEDEDPDPDEDTEDEDEEGGPDGDNEIPNFDQGN